MHTQLYVKILDASSIFNQSSLRGSGQWLGTSAAESYITWQRCRTDSAYITAAVHAMTHRCAAPSKKLPSHTVKQAINTLMYDVLGRQGTLNQYPGARTPLLLSF